MGVSKVIYNTENGEEVLVDLTGDSVTPEMLAAGATAHNAAGDEIVGILQVVTKEEITPVKGVDYWTEADQEAIVQQVITALGTPVFGRVDAEKVITLNTEHLANGTYKLVAEGKDGALVELCTYVIGGIDNLADPTSADWVKNYRLNSSGTATNAADNNITNYIPCVAGDVIRVKGLDISHYYTNGASAGAVGRCVGWAYKADKTAHIKTNALDSNNALCTGYANSGDVWEYTVGADMTGDTSLIRYMRFSGILYNGYTLNDVIITVNQEIS